MLPHHRLISTSGLVSTAQQSNMGALLSITCAVVFDPTTGDDEEPAEASVEPAVQKKQRKLQRNKFHEKMQRDKENAENEEPALEDDLADF